MTNFNYRSKKYKSSLFIASLCLIVSFFTNQPAVSQEYLSTSEAALISTASFGTVFVSHHVRRMDSTRTPLIGGPLLFDNTIQNLFGGTFKRGQCNFLDNKFGSVITPVSAGSLLLLTNLSYPQADRGKGTMQDLFLYTSGLLITKGITGLAKGIVTRPRPYRSLGPSHQCESYGFLTDRSSFFSGHTSSAFFASAYLNLRMRSTMRSEMSSGDYNNWKWAPPTILFSWASLVGLSRIHAHKHYFTDIVTGALAGYLIAELMYSLNDNNAFTNPTTESSQFLFRIKINL